MAQEIVEAVRKAEMQAEETERKAIAEAAAIRKLVQAETEVLTTAMINDENRKAEAALAEAQMLASQRMKAAETAAEQEIIKLKETAKLKEEQIIGLIIAELI